MKDAEKNTAAEKPAEAEPFADFSNGAENPSDRCAKIFMSPDETASYFLPGGKVEKTFGEGYEFRKQQQSAVREITAAFNSDSISLLEAPTGTGKTLSYLIPSARWAVSSGEKVVISTNTINLQDQIISKDMPLLREILEEKIKYSLVKGMSNYLCLLRAETVKSERGMFAEKSGGDEEAKILEWAGQTDDGSISALGFAPTPEVWENFAAETEGCIRRECPYYKRCFFFKARRKVAESDLIVVNHHLLFSDISIKNFAGKPDAGILPPARRIVMDEAHNLLDSATSHFSARVSNLAVLKTLGRLRRVISSAAKIARRADFHYQADDAMERDKISADADFASQMDEAVHKKIPAVERNKFSADADFGSQMDETVHKILRGMKKVFQPRIEKVEEISAVFFESLFVAASEFSGKENGRSDGFTVRVRKDETGPGGIWHKAVSVCPEIRAHLLDLSAAAKEAVLIIGESGGDETAGIVAELKAVLSSLERMAAVADSFADTAASGDFVKSIEIRQKNKNAPFAAVCISPIDIAAHLNEKLYSKYRTVIMTSATLAAEGDFDFQQRSLGLNENPRLSRLAVPSPFNYKRQALLALVSDLPEPGAGAHFEKLSEAVFELVRASKGGALVLFTSRELLRKTAELLRARLTEIGIESFVQGEQPRERLLEKFKSHPSAALFATDSFREGVDVAGDALRLVVITRLPFRVPDEPVFQARMEAAAARGEDAFSAYAVPLAIIGFRQAFGRLIRTAADRGAVAVLDSRIVRKRYGKSFVQSIPQCQTARGSVETVAKRLRKFFEPARSQLPRAAVKPK